MVELVPCSLAEGIHLQSAEFAGVFGTDFRGKRPNPGNSPFPCSQGIRPNGGVAELSRQQRPRATAGFGVPREIRAIKTMIEAGTPVTVAAIADPMTDLRQLSSQAVEYSPIDPGSPITRR